MSDDEGDVLMPAMASLILQDLILRTIAATEHIRLLEQWRHTHFCHSGGPYLLCIAIVFLVPTFMSCIINRLQNRKGSFWMDVVVCAVVIMTIGHVGSIITVCGSAEEVDPDDVISLDNQRFYLPITGYMVYTLLSAIAALCMFGFAVWIYDCEPDFLTLLLASLCLQQGVWKVTDFASTGVMCKWGGVPAITLLLVSVICFTLWGRKLEENLLMVFFGILLADFALTRTGDGIILCLSENIEDDLAYALSFWIALVIEVPMLGILVWGEISEYHRNNLRDWWRSTVRGSHDITRPPPSRDTDNMSTTRHTNPLASYVPRYTSSPNPSLNSRHRQATGTSIPLVSRYNTRSVQLQLHPEGDEERDTVTTFGMSTATQDHGSALRSATAPPSYLDVEHHPDVIISPTEITVRHPTTSQESGGIRAEAPPPSYDDVTARTADYY